jgi:hypothetical protein
VTTPSFQSNATSPSRSGFVTVVAWIFIVVSGFTTFISLLQNVVLAFMPKDLFNQALQDTTFTHAMPSAPRFMFAHVHTIVLAILIVCAATLVSSIGLLRRRNWARLVFIGLLAIGAVYNIAALFVQQSMLSSFNAPFAADSTLRAAGGQFQQMMQAMRVAMFIFELGFAALFVWIIVRLLSRDIREEFVPPARAA